ncbi:MAG: MvdC/MvdD family ATP grasp protein [Patescibacteria group bacterium]
MTTKKKILIVGCVREKRNIDAVTRYLRDMGEEFVVFDTALFPEKKILNIHLRGNSKSIGGFLKDASLQDKIGWEDVKSVWMRKPEIPQAKINLPQWQIDFVQSESRAALYSLYTSIDCFWMNHPLVSMKLLEHNKLYQLKTAIQLGLQIPETVVTNDPDELLSFCEHCGGELAIKSIRGRIFREYISRKALSLFTRRITYGELLKQRGTIALAPVFAQRYIAKKIELRITIAGHKIFACAIHSQDSEKTKHDWRNYDFQNVQHEAFILPESIKEKLQALMRFWKLSFGAIDMILTPKEEYVFLEVNPGGQWGWIEDLAGLPISRAIAETLAHPPREMETVPF